MCWWIFGHCWHPTGEDFIKQPHGIHDTGKYSLFQMKIILRCCWCNKEKKI